MAVAIPVGAELAPAALVWLAHQLRQTPEAKWIYGDHDLLDEKGKRHSPDFKPDWNETLLHSQNYIGWSGLWREQGTFAIPQDGGKTTAAGCSWPGSSRPKISRISPPC